MTRWIQRTPSIRDLDAYLDDELTPAQRLRVEDALARSASLRADLDQLRELRVAMAPQPEPAVAADLVERVQQALASGKYRARVLRAVPDEPERPVRNPVVWMSTTYFVMGLIYALLTQSANIMFLDLKAGVQHAVLWSSLLGVPYVLKFIWAPLLELYKTKKFFVVLMQLAIVCSLVGVAAALALPDGHWRVPVLVLLAATGIFGATMDSATDGIYVTALDSKAQTRYFAFQTMSWSTGALVMGPLVSTTGILQSHRVEYAGSWAAVLLGCAALVLVAAVHHARVLPRGSRAADAPASVRDAVRGFARAYTTFFEKKGVLAMIAFAFLYRIGYAVLEKTGPSYLKDFRYGGLNLSNQTVGLVDGTIGAAALVAGAFLGSRIVSRIGLKSSLLALCLCMNIPNVTFLIINHLPPSNIGLMALLVAVAKFGYGIGSTGQMLYMMQQIAPGPYETAHYTFATALMGACMTAAGAISGALVGRLGYPSFFAVVVLTAIPSILATVCAPFYNPERAANPHAAHA